MSLLALALVVAGIALVVYFVLEPRAAAREPKPPARDEVAFLEGGRARD